MLILLNIIKSYLPEANHINLSYGELRTVSSWDLAISQDLHLPTISSVAA